MTINENDGVLKASDVVNPKRLGNTIKRLEAPNATYFDFTDGLAVGSNHRLWAQPAKKNPTVKEFFSSVLRGGRGETLPGFEFRADINAFQLVDKVVNEED